MTNLRYFVEKYLKILNYLGLIGILAIFTLPSMGMRINSSYNPLFFFRFTYTYVAFNEPEAGAYLACLIVYWLLYLSLITLQFIALAQTKKRSGLYIANSVFCFGLIIMQTLDMALDTPNLSYYQTQNTAVFPFMAYIITWALSALYIIISICLNKQKRNPTNPVKEVDEVSSETDLKKQN
mgnify:CR=1 FL=1